MFGRNSPTGSLAAPPFARPSRRRAPPSSPLRAPPRARFAPAPAGTLHPLTEGLSRQLFQTYLSCRSWCASSPKDPVIATSPAYHGHPPQRLLLNSPDTTIHDTADRQEDEVAEMRISRLSERL